MPLLERLHAMSSQLALSVTIGFSRAMLDAYDAGELDAVMVRQEGSRRGGEKLTEDEFGWFAPALCVAAAAKHCRSQRWRRPAACARLRVRALDKAGIAWSEAFVGGGVTAVAAAALAGPRGRAAGPAHRARRTGRHRAGARACRELGTSKVMLHSKVSDPAKLAALRTLAATFRSVRHIIAWFRPHWPTGTAVPVPQIAAVQFPAFVSVLAASGTKPSTVRLRPIEVWASYVR